MMLMRFYSFSQNNFIPPNGYVPDAETAKKIAEAIWLPIYGISVLDEKPYRATLIGDTVWKVYGSLHNEGDTLTATYFQITVGGVAMIELRKKDCKVLKVIHEK